MLPVFKLYCKAVVIKAVQYWLKDRDTGEWKRIERSEINLAIDKQMISTKKVVAGALASLLHFPEPHIPQDDMEEQMKPACVAGCCPTDEEL